MTIKLNFSNIRKPSLETCLAAIRTEVHITKLKSHPAGKVRNCLKCDDEINNTKYSLFHCLIVQFIWDLIGDLMRIMIGSSINIEVRVVLLKFYTIKRDMENWRNRLYINTLLVIDRRVIYTLFHREDKTVKNNIIS